MPYASPKRTIILGTVAFFLYILSAVIILNFPEEWNPKRITGILLGVSIVVSSGYRLIQIFSTKKWLEVEATIVKSSLKGEKVFSRFTENYFFPSIEYKYVIDNTTYVSNQLGRIRNDYKFRIEKEALAIQKKFPLQTKTKIFVNPRNVKEAILFQKTTKSKLQDYLGYNFIGIFVIVLSIIVTIK